MGASQWDGYKFNVDMKHLHQTTCASCRWLSGLGASCGAAYKLIKTVTSQACCHLHPNHHQCTVVNPNQPGYQPARPSYLNPVYHNPGTHPHHPDGDNQF